MAKKKYVFEKMVGYKVNHLTVESKTDRKAKSGEEIWNFRCDCGKLVSCKPSQIFLGFQKSCGCDRKARSSFTSKTREKNAKNLIGKRSGRLVVYDYKIQGDATQTILYCTCDCGNNVQTKINTFRYGMKKSCGCLQKNKKRNEIDRKYPDLSRGEYQRLYAKYRNMKMRCFNKSDRNYKRYGGRGIKICDKWLTSPSDFIKWAIENGGLNKDLSLDRIDNNGDYCPENCRFISVNEQNRNKGNNVKILYNGETRLLLELAEEYKINPSTLRSRISNGWSVEKALTTPVKKRAT